MEENKGVPLSSIIKEFKLEVLSQSSQFDKTKIQVTSINRPGLQLMGYYDYFDEKRVQLLGKAEYSYMRTMTADQRFTFFDSLFSRGIPALIIARDLEIFPECYRAAERQDCTVLRTNQVTGEFMSDLTAALRSHLAPRITRHGVLMEVYGEGVLLMGESGVGKSETAVELVKRGHRLVADDAVEIRHIGTRLVGSAPELIRHYIELRGIGVVDIQQLFGMSAVREDQDINLVVNLEQWNDQVFYDRLGTNEEFTTILDMKIPAITIPIKPGRNLAIIVEVAAMNNRHKRMGYNAAQEFAKQLDAHFEQMMLSSQLDAADDYDEYESLSGEEEE